MAAPSMKNGSGWRTIVNAWLGMLTSGRGEQSQFVQDPSLHGITQTKEIGLAIISVLLNH